MALRILHLEDSAIDAELVKSKLEDAGLACAIDRVDTEGAFHARLAQGGFDVILSDYTLPSFDGLTALSMAREKCPDVPFIFVSSTIGEDRAVEAYKQGATDYLLKSNLPRLIPAIERALKEVEEHRERRRAEELLRVSEEHYRSLFENMLNGYAHCRMLFEQGRPVDFVYLEVNGAFESLTGLKNVSGKKATEVIPGIYESDPELFEIYGRVTSTGKPERFERYVNALRMWFRISAYRPKKEHFVAVFDVITEHKQAEEALRESEKKYRDLFNSTLDGIYRADADGNFVLMNPAGARIFGYEKPEDLLGRNAREFWRIPPDRDAYVAKLRVHKKLSAYPIEAKKRDGEPIELESSSRIIEDREGRIIGIEGVLRDVTIRKTTEEKLRSSVKFWDDTFDAMNDAVSVMDHRGRILRSNRAMNELVAKYPHEIIDHPCWEVLHAASGRIDDCPFLIMLRTRQRQSAAVQFLSRWFRITVDPIVDETGDLLGGIHIMTDITEHRKFEEWLRESENKFRSLAEQALVGTYIIQDNVFKYVNPRFAEMFGYSIDAIIDRMGPFDVIVPEDHHLIREHMQRRLSGEVRSSHYEARGRKQNAETIHLEIFGSVSEYEGRPATIGAVLDTTDKRKLESQLVQAQKMEAVGQLTGGIAHDFNNILSVIISYGHLLRKELSPDDHRRLFADQILAASDRASNLTRSLLTFSRKQVTSTAQIDVNEIIEKVGMLLRCIIGEDINLQTELHQQGLFVNADAGQLEQVLMNLAANARDAMPQGGMLLITTGVADAGEGGKPPEAGESGEYALISVSDTGVGMDERTREKIFEPFFTTKGPGKGSGLGLSMVYGIISQHRGHIHCYSEPGKGSTFRIYLPLLPPNKATRAVSKTPADLQEPRRGTETILVAEDDAQLRKITVLVLRQYGYTVIESIDGADAMEKLRRHKDAVRLILCDVIMPKISGGEAEKEFRKIAPRARTVFLSGYPADIIRQKSLIDGDADILLKPITPLLLLGKVREVLDNG